MKICPRCNETYSGALIPLVCPSCKVELTALFQRPKTERTEGVDESRTSGSLVWGIICLVAGIIGYLVSAPKMNEFKSFWGQLVAGLDKSTAQQFQMWQIIYYGSIVAIVIGSLLFLTGVIQKAIQKQ